MDYAILFKEYCSLEQSFRLKQLGVTAPGTMWTQLLPEYLNDQTLAGLYAYSSGMLGQMLYPMSLYTHMPSYLNKLPKDKMIVQIGGNTILEDDGNVKQWPEYTTDPCDSEAWGRCEIVIRALEDGELKAEEINKRLSSV